MADAPTSTDWWIAFRGTVAVQAGLGAGVAWFLLGQRSQNFSWPVLFFAGPSMGVNIQAVPYTNCSFAPFRTSSALAPTDFNSFGAILQAAGSLGFGGIAINANFYSVDHAPNPLMMDGADIGFGFSVGWVPGRFKVLDWMTVANAGSSVSAPMAALDDSSDLSDAVSDTTDDYVQNNTDATYMA